jgi:hypothetical protein
MENSEQLETNQVKKKSCGEKLYYEGQSSKVHGKLGMTIKDPNTK